MKVSFCTSAPSLPEIVKVKLDVTPCGTLKEEGYGWISVERFYFISETTQKKPINRKKVVLDILESNILVHKAVPQMKRFLFMNKQ